jgi:hypothetical protein
MTRTHAFWDELVADGLLDPDEAAEARRRQRKLGGAPDTAVLEVRPLGTSERQRLLRALGRALDQPIAPPELLEDPDPDALRAFPRELAALHGLLPVRFDPHRLVLVTPALGPHVLAELAHMLGREVEPYLALELDVRRALWRRLGLVPGDRHVALVERYAAAPPVGLHTIPPTPAPAPLLEVVEVTTPRARQVRIEPPLDAEPTLPDPPPAASEPWIAGPTEVAPRAANRTEAVAWVAGPTEVARTEPDPWVGGPTEIAPRATRTELDALIAAFPGALRVDRYSAEPGAVPIDAHGPVLASLLALGEAAVPPLRTLAEAPGPDVRYYAVALLGALDEPRALGALVPRLFDKDRAVRAMAAQVLADRAEPEIRSVAVRALVRALASDSAVQRRCAAEALGRLRADAAVPALIAALERGADDAVHAALVAIARVDPGPDAAGWQAWYDREGHRPRAEWLLDALLSDQRHLRVGAWRELLRLGHPDPGYDADAPAATRERLVERWRRWWAQEGRFRLTAPSATARSLDASPRKG